MKEASGFPARKERVASAPDAVRAKTGLLDGVTGLSGYAQGADGLLVFSVIANGHRRGDEAGRPTSGSQARPAA